MKTLIIILVSLSIVIPSICFSGSNYQHNQVQSHRSDSPMSKKPDTYKIGNITMKLIPGTDTYYNTEKYPFGPPENLVPNDYERYQNDLREKLRDDHNRGNHHNCQHNDRNSHGRNTDYLHYHIINGGRYECNDPTHISK